MLTGAGISAESGIKTFRDADGLWEEYNVMDVATPEAWQRDSGFVQDFYNKRRKQLLTVKPNPGHLALAQAQEFLDVQIITQNIDNLHEAAGSHNVLHLHGELLKARSSVDPSLIYDIDGWEIPMGKKCEKGSQLRPHVVWFGEPVPAIPIAADIVASADLLAIVGTSLNVYPAASLIDYAPSGIPIYLIDPKDVMVAARPNLTFIQAPASTGVPKMIEMIKDAGVM